MKREQKVFACVLLLCAPIAITLAAVQIRRSIIMPFTAPIEQLFELDKIFGQTDEEKAEEAKRKDTDGDGLSDWDEANLYQTSAYLADTDSDGDPDNIEIANQTDPNCPKGQVCVQAISAGQSGGDASGMEGGVIGQDPAIVPDRNPASIRLFLRSQGVSETDLAGYSDQDLLDAYDSSQALFAEGETSEDDISMLDSAPTSSVISITP